MRSVLSLSPGEVGAWRSHFQRFPWDSTDRLLAQLIALQCAEPKPTDSDLRPWAYTDLQAEARRRQTDEREERAQRALAKLGGGLNWWQGEG